MPFTRIILLPVIVASAALAEVPVDFNRDIRPIFTKHCTACHGGVKQAGGLSFLSRDLALGTGESGKRAIVPGDPANSEMLRRIRSTDPDEVMPQPKHGPPLATVEADLIERWIREGAQWREHWAFEKPVEPELPAATDKDWSKVPMDHFVLDRLQKEDLAPSPAAPPEEWLRRASFDLTGLPPSPAELSAFLKQHAADPDAARRDTVERLLASPAYGERWAAVWLDLARYSDTYGFEKDPNRNIWPWRDWVIRAFNTDMPYDQFTIEQLAGDLLPNATADQRLATAFHRNTMNNTEGGTDDEEFRVAAVLDRVSTTWTAWQGFTFGCIQCHAHPYEGVSHEEFYEFTAFFNNTLDCDQDDDFPRMKIANDPAQRETASSLETRIRELRDSLNRDGHLADVEWQPFRPDKLKPAHGALSLDDSGVIRFTGTQPTRSHHDLEGFAAPFSAIRLRIMPDSDDPTQWPERGSFATHFEVRLTGPDGKATPMKMKEVFVDRIDGPKEPTAGGNVGGYPKLEGPRWAVFVPTETVEPTTGSRLAIHLKQHAATTGEQAVPLRNYAIDFSHDPRWTTLAADPGRAARHAELAELRKQYQTIPGTLVPVMVERPGAAPRETRIFARGNRLSKEDAVSPGMPKLFLGGKNQEFASRLDMARWLVGPDNPLAARVLANRLWAELFGTGIVRSLEDFGSSGEAPSNQELLDHLALRLRDHHQWSIKSMLREIALSATYGQTHRVPAGLAGRDPENRLLARGPRVRLKAEMIRDQSLAAAGMLSPKQYGPPVFPPQPEGVWKSVYSGAKWKESEGEDRVRRAIYTYHKRTSAHPAFITFDAPARDVCSARRIASNTPLQALVTLNDPAHIEAAQGLAARMTEHSADPAECLAHGVRLVTQREADDAMLTELATLLRDATAEYRADPKLAAPLAPDSNPETAALVLVANTLLNLDAALNR